MRPAGQASAEATAGRRGPDAVHARARRRRRCHTPAGVRRCVPGAWCAVLLPTSLLVLRVSRHGRRDAREVAGDKMRIFVAGLSTETNTFTPMPTTRDDFRIYNPGPGSEGKTKPHPAYTILHRRAPKDGIVVLEGLSASAPPSGTVRQDTYEEFRDEILEQVTAAMPLDGVVLGLHGVRHTRQPLLRPSLRRCACAVDSSPLLW
eukprot:COSAG03_NODE_452_length_7787_cov_30.352107_4_plen_205_part_00